MKSLCSLKVISGSERHLGVKKQIKRIFKTESKSKFYESDYDSPQHLHNILLVLGNPVQ